MTTQDKGITVLRATAENFRRLRLAQVEVIPGVGLVKVTGKKAAGKTTVLNMVREAFGGAGEVLPNAVNIESEDGKGHFLIELSNGYSIERRYTEAAPKGYLTITGPDGGRHTQAKLNEWLGPLSFDPLAFFGLKPERQGEILLASGGDSQLPAKLEDLRTERRQKYEKRTPWISQKRKAAGIPQPTGDRPEAVDVTGEVERLGELQAQKMALGSEESRIRILEHNEQEASGRIGALRDELIEAEERQKHFAQELEEANAGYAKLPDPSDELTEVRARLASADAVSEALDPWKAWDNAQAEIKQAEKLEKALTKAMEKIALQERELIQGAAIPITGLTFTEEAEPLLNGLPLAVASGGERIQMAVEVALASGSELHICLIPEANDLDLEGLEVLDELAKVHGFQIWAARIGLEGPGEIVVENGEATTPEAPES